MDKIEDDIEEDREGRSKDEMDEKFLIKTVPNCKNIFGYELTNLDSQGECVKYWAKASIH